MPDDREEPSTPSGQQGDARVEPLAGSSAAAEDPENSNLNRSDDEQARSSLDPPAPETADLSAGLSQPAALEAVRRAAQQAQLQPAALEAMRRAAQQAQLQPAALEAMRRAAQQAQLQPAALEAMRRAAQQAQLQPAALEAMRRVAALEINARGTAHSRILVALAQAAATFNAQRPVAESVRLLAESPEFAAWRRAAAQVLGSEEGQTDSATRVEDESEQAADALAHSSALATAVSEVVREDESLSTAVHLGTAAQDIVDGGNPTDEGLTDEALEALSPDELEVLRAFVLLFGGAHLTALLVVVASVTGIGLLGVLGTLAALASLSGYSLRDLLRPQD